MTLTIETTPFQFVAVYGYDPQVIHCLMTGAPIGRLYDHEFEGLIKRAASLEDLRIRTIAAMRPSARWNKLDPQTLIEMCDERPREVLSYLMNRLFQATPTMKSDLWLERESRIITYQVSATLPDEYVSKLTHRLIELDAKIGLHTIYPDSRSKLSLDDFAFEAMHAEHANQLARIDQFVLNLSAYAKRLLTDAVEREEMHLRMTSPWAKRLYVKSWMEQQPESKTAEAKRERTERNDDMAEMIRRVSTGKIECESTEAKPVVTAAFKAGFAALKKMGA
jgi:hypothetical protein